ncbi:MAG: hypothetical protein AAGA96_15170 [Verrucomicrobiota bacterium]
MKFLSLLLITSIQIFDCLAEESHLDALTRSGYVDLIAKPPTETSSAEILEYAKSKSKTRLVIIALTERSEEQEAKVRSIIDVLSSMTKESGVPSLYIFGGKDHLQDLAELLVKETETHLKPLSVVPNFKRMFWLVVTEDVVDYSFRDESNQKNNTDEFLNTLGYFFEPFEDPEELRESDSEALLSTRVYIRLLDKNIKYKEGERDNLLSDAKQLREEAAELRGESGKLQNEASDLREEADVLLEEVEELDDLIDRMRN